MPKNKRKDDKSINNSNIAELIVGQGEQLISAAEERIHQRITDLSRRNADEALEAYLDRIATKVNVLHIGPQAGKAQLSIEDLEPLFEFAVLKPHLQPYSFAFIEDAQKLNAISQNKLLKLLEEPPFYLQIVLLAKSAAGILQTIKSRCHISYLAPSDPSKSELLRSIATSFFSPRMEGEVTRAYLEFDALVQKEKVSAGKVELVEGLLQEISRLIASTLANGGELDIAKLRTQQMHLDRSLKYLRSNVNTKLIIDNLFLSFK